MGLPGFESDDIPGITSSYIDNEATDSMFSSWNIFFLFLMMVLGGIFYKMRNRKPEDDEFVKTSDDRRVYEKFFNPFNRKDHDDDFDKVL